MSSKLPKLDFIKHTDVIFLFFIKMKFTPLTFSREFEIGFALYLQKHKENLISTFTLRMGGSGKHPGKNGAVPMGGVSLLIFCISTWWARGGWPVRMADISPHSTLTHPMTLPKVSSCLFQASVSPFVNGRLRNT